MGAPGKKAVPPKAPRRAKPAKAAAADKSAEGSDTVSAPTKRGAKKRAAKIS